MNAFLKYLGYIIRHKRFVYQEGRKLGVARWQLLLHDWHKLLPDEFFPYMEMFYGHNGGSYYVLDKNDPRRIVVEAEFNRAWLKHQRRSRHHWQAHLLLEDSGAVKPLEVPERLVREMLADWRGAGRAITGKDDTLNWYVATKAGRILHPRTQGWLEGQLGLS